VQLGVFVYIAYLDEFGHIGPYISRDHPNHNTSPVFGLAGLVLPAGSVRSFATWFFKRKCELLAWEIERSGAHPAQWEKKGSSLYTVKNVERYRELRNFTNRFLRKITSCGGFVIFVGVRKTNDPRRHCPNKLYVAILIETIKRIDQFCTEDCLTGTSFLLVMDEHDQRSAFITEAAKAMFHPTEPRRNLIEAPFQVESHRYQTLQAADWIAGLVGRLGTYWIDRERYEENMVFRRYFEDRLNDCARRSGIRAV